VQGLVERTRASFRGFIEQRDDLIAVVRCEDSDTAVVLKLFRDIEEASDTDVLLLFGDDFIEPGPYVSVAVERLAEQHRIACEFALEQGLEPLAPMPDELFDDAAPPVRRLFDAVAYASTLVPRGGGNRLVWVMCPAQIVDRDEYLRLVRVFLPNRGVEPWMAGLRLVFRDGIDTEQQAPDIVQCPRVHLIDVDFGQESIERGLDEDAQNEELPEDQRVQALLSLAVIDGAHGRMSEAASKFELALGHYQETGNLPMQAFVTNAFGDLCRAAGDVDKAQHWYECATVPATEGKDALVLAAITRNLGELAYERRRFAEAEQYFDGLDQLAAHLLQPETKASALQWRGLSQEQQGHYDAATESYEASALLCRNIGLPTLLRESLEHLERLYERARRPGLLRDVRAELATLEQEEAE
jgi:Tfp pilus assembly protein PilF